MPSIKHLQEALTYSNNTSNTSKIKSRVTSVKETRYDDLRQQLNDSAIRMGYAPPNKLSYEKTKGGNKRKTQKRRNTQKHRKTRISKK
jgi:hypothetical protein